MAVVAASTCLTLAEVENELREVTAADWFPLGVQLGIRPAKLREIEKDHPGDVQRCKTEVLDWWHRNTPEISWRKVAQALEAIGGYVHLVQRLERSGTYALGDPHVIQRNGSSFHPELVASQGSSPISNGHCHSGRDEGGNIYDDALTKAPLRGCKGIVSIHEPDLELETHFLRSKFNVLFTKVRRSLEQQGVQVDDFISFLKGVPAYTAGEQSLFSAEFPGLYQKRSLTSVFDQVRDYTSWFNYSFISDIVDAYCENNESIRKTLQEFQQLLQRYCKHRVCKCSLRNGFGFGRKRACAHMVLKIDKEWKTIRVKQVEEVTSNLARILNVHRRALYLRSVENGCVQLTFIVSNALAAAIFPLSTEQQAQLVEIGVILLHCGDHQFLNPPLGFTVATPSYNLTAQLISCTELLLSSNGRVLELFHTGDKEMLSAALNLWAHYFYHPQNFLMTRILPKGPAESLNVWLHTSKEFNPLITPHRRVELQNGRFNSGIGAPALATEDEQQKIETKDHCITLPLDPATSPGSTSHQNEHPAESDHSSRKRRHITFHLDEALPESVSHPDEHSADNEPMQLSTQVPTEDNIAGRGIQPSRNTRRGLLSSFMKQLSCGLTHGIVNVFSRNRHNQHPSYENFETGQVHIDEQSKRKTDVRPNQQNMYVPSTVGRKISGQGNFHQHHDSKDIVAQQLCTDRPGKVEGTVAGQNEVPYDASSGLHSELPFSADDNMYKCLQDGLLTGSEPPTPYNQLPTLSPVVSAFSHGTSVYSGSHNPSVNSVCSPGINSYSGSHSTSGYSGCHAVSVYSVNSHSTTDSSAQSHASSVYRANSHSVSVFSGSHASSMYSANSRSTSGFSGSHASSVYSANSRSNSGFSGSHSSSMYSANSHSTSGFSGSHASSMYSANSRSTSGFSGSHSSSMYSANSRSTSGFSGSHASSVYSANSRSTSGFSGSHALSSYFTHYSGSHAPSTYSSSYEVGNEKAEAILLHTVTQHPPCPHMTAIRDHNPCCYQELAVRKGQRVKVLNWKGGWVYAVTKSGKAGYLPFAFLRPSCKYRSKSASTSANTNVCKYTSYQSDFGGIYRCTYTSTVETLV